MKRGFGRNVLLTGFTSFFTDVSSEMVYPLLQSFLRLVLAGQRALLGPLLGVIEGLAESTASLLKLFSGYYSDRTRRRKLPAIAGYAGSAASKLLLFLSGVGWPFVLVSRFLDRVGKGIRTAPRDALIAESVPPGARGRAFGFQRGMDFAGATLGAAASFFLVRRLLDPATGNLRAIGDFYRIFLISVIPAFLAVVFLFFVRETTGGPGGGKPRPNLDLRRYDRRLQLFFLAELLFTLGNSSNQFLLLRSADLGWPLHWVILMYLLFNLCSSLLAAPLGALSDRIGRRRLLLAGYALYAAVYGAFGFLTPSSRALLWVFWPLYGLYYALTEGVEKAYVADIAPADSRATALGFYHTLVGIGLLPASLVAGLLFRWRPSAPFVFGGAMALAAVLVLGLVKPAR